MSRSKRTRRQFLAGATGTGLALGLAGCTSTRQTGGEPTTDGSTTTHNEEDEENHTAETEAEDGTEHHDEEEEGEHHDEEEEGEHHDEEEEDEHHDEEGDEHGHNHDEGTPQEPAETVEVVMRTEGGEQHYAPHVVWIEPGGTVTWKNERGQHNAVAYHPENGDKPLRIPDAAEPWSTALLTEGGETASHTFETEGIYDYFCAPHEAVGMVGTVIVGEPDAHGQPALEEPQSSLPEGARSELADLAEKVNEALGHTH